MIKPLRFFTLLLVMLSTAAGAGENSHIRVAVGEFKTITTQEDVLRVAVANPETLDYIVISKREILLNGKRIGTTSLNIWLATGSQAKHQVEVIDRRAAKLSQIINNPRVGILFEGDDIILTGVVQTSNDKGKAGDAAKAFLAGKGAVKNLLQIAGLTSLQQKMEEITGNLDVKVTYTDRGVILSGKAKSVEQKADIEKVIRAYLPDPTQDVTNVLEVWRKPRQIRLKVRVMEIEDKLTRKLGIDWGAMTGVTTITTASGLFHDQFTAGSALNARTWPRFQVGFRRSQPATMLDQLMVQVTALIDSGIIRILAEPEVVALIGQASDVLIGGEIPIPVPGQNGTVTIMWKEHGIKMKLQPDIDDEGRISSNIFVEVSTLDFPNGVVISGFTIPAMKTTRATSKIHVKPGETVFLSGLKRQQDEKSTFAVPGFSSMPVVGEAFINRTKKRTIVDLIISVTPYLVDEEDAGNLGR